MRENLGSAMGGGCVSLIRPVGSDLGVGVRSVSVDEALWTFVAAWCRVFGSVPVTGRSQSGGERASVYEPVWVRISRRWSVTTRRRR
jgi:hypothetical protein